MPRLETMMRSKICPKEVASLFVVVVAVALNVTAAFTTAKSAGQDAGQEASASKQSLDFEFFKTRVEPIFLKRRGDHARCYVCHSVGSGAPQYLVKLSPGSTFWTDDQSRRIFQNVSKLVDRDDPMNSRILIHPLSPMAGGDITYVHGGGRQFASKKDPDWQTIAEWIRGRKVASSSGP